MGWLEKVGGGLCLILWWWAVGRGGFWVGLPGGRLVKAGSVGWVAVFVLKWVGFLVVGCG